MFVVPYSKIYNDIGASIEFALGFFNITDVIICGHSQCSACETIFKGVDVKNNRQLEQWLEQKKGSFLQIIQKSNLKKNPFYNKVKI
jgi:carbonic anhydrase